MNPVQRAIEDFGKLHDLIKEGVERDLLDRKVGQSFRARARSMIGMIDDIGLVPALSFCFANATKSVYDRVVKAWREGWDALTEQEKTATIEAEEGGYAFYLFLALSYLHDIGVLKSDAAQPVEALGELAEVQTLAAKLLVPYCIEVKRLAEAVYGEG